MKVSIIIPNFNRENLILEALQSVVNQRHRPIEVIVVDDGSRDNSVAAIRQFRDALCEEALTIHLVEQKNAGSVAARNRGIQEASGDALLFLDSDDVLTRDGLADLVRILNQDPALDFVYAKVEETDGALVPFGSEIGHPSTNLVSDLVDYTWHTMGALYRHELVQRVGGWYPGINGSDDWIFQSRIKLSAKQFQFIDTVVGKWRQHPGERLGATQFRASYTEDVTRACLAIFNEAKSFGLLTPSIQEKLARRCLRHVWELGVHHALEERRRAAERLREICQAPCKLRFTALLGGLRRIDPLAQRIVTRFK